MNFLNKFKIESELNFPLSSTLIPQPILTSNNLDCITNSILEKQHLDFSNLMNPNFNGEMEKEIFYDTLFKDSENLGQILKKTSNQKSKKRQRNTTEPQPTQKSSKPVRAKKQKTNEQFWGTMVKSNSTVTPTQRKLKEGIMERFPNERVADFKHFIYNLLVDNYNDPEKNNFVSSFSIIENGKERRGFRFNEDANPEKKLPEFYALHVRRADLEVENQHSIFIQDLYKFYLRSCLELLAKYFEKRDRFTFLYMDVPLFVPGSSLDEADARMSKMSTRQRKSKKPKH